jgi:hypothetical protein
VGEKDKGANEKWHGRRASVICGRGGATASGKCEDGKGEVENKMWSDARDPIDQIVQLDVYM